MASTTTSLVLLLEVAEGKDILPPKHNSASTAFYISAEFGNQKRKTKTVKNSLEPNWGETFDFDIDQKEVPTVNLTLCDKGWTGGTPVSRVSFKVPAKLLGGSADTVEEWHPLQPLKQGKSASGAILVRLRTTKKRTIKKNKSMQHVDAANATLFTMIRANDYDMVEEYLKRATPDDVNKAEEKTGNTALHAACLDCKTLDERILTSMLEFDGIKVDVPNADLNTPLHYFCAKWQNPEITPLEMMLKKGAQVNFANSNNETAIFKAIWNESIRTLLMETLIEHGARADLVNTFGESILHYAVRFGRSDLVNLILGAVPKVDIKGMEGKTPYEVAVQYKHVTIAKHLKKVEELFQWLDKHDLGAHKGVFLKNEIYKNLLSDLTDSLLERMGVEPADRAKILAATKQLDKEEAEHGVDMDAGHGEEVDDAKAEKIKGELAELTPLHTADGKDWVIDGKDLEYLKRLGSGTSGDVYKGLYKQNHVAIKVLKEMTEEQERDEFKKEFKVMCAVHHPNIVQFFGASFKPKLCMVMEYCARGSLYHVLRDETLDINWDRAISLMMQTTEGLHALHTNTPQIMHRDLKSLNLLVTDDWQVKVADFGLSRFDTAEALETLKQMRGTFAYCAPESYNGAKYTIKSDIYSTGIIFWEVINRVLKGVYEQPYSEYKNIQFDFQIIIQASKDHLRPTLPTTTPTSLQNLVKACVHPENESRPTGSELLTMITAVKADYTNNKHQWDALVRSVAVKGKK